MILGLDLSLKATGAVVLNPAGEIIHRESIVYHPDRKEMTETKSGKSDTLTVRQKIERLRDIAFAVNKIVGEKGVEVVGIEGYAFSRKSASVTGLAELGGVVRFCLLQGFWETTPMTIPVSKARKFVMGKNGTKAVANKWFDDNIRVEGKWTEDEKDAYFIAETVRCAVYYQERQRLRLEQLAHLDEIVRTLKREMGNDFQLKGKNDA